MDNDEQELIDLDQVLTDLEFEHRNLVFQEFNSNTSLEVGLYLIGKAKEDQKEITVDITLGKQQLFHCALEGTSFENDEWIARKNRVTLKFQKSSYYISILLKSQNKSIEEAYDLSSDDYAPFGGAYPIITQNGGFVGTITVSGLPDYEDHEMVVNGIKWYLREQRMKSER